MISWNNHRKQRKQNSKCYRFTAKLKSCQNLQVWLTWYLLWMSKCQADGDEPLITTRTAWNQNLCRKKQREHEMDLRREFPVSQPVFTGRCDQLMWDMHLNLGEIVPNLLGGECKDPQQAIKGQQSASLRTPGSPDRTATAPPWQGH